MRLSNISQMQSYEIAYGQTLSNGKVLAIVLPFCLVPVVYVLMLTLSVVSSIIIGLVAYLFARYFILPQEIQVRYLRRGMEQRHTFMNIITQRFGNGKSKVDTITALKDAEDSIWGEFRQDIERLIGTITESGHGMETHKVFTRIRYKYRDDIWFDEFMEQLETTNESGHINADAFHDICNNANNLFALQERYIARRHFEMRYLYTIMYAIIPAILVIAVMFGWQNYERIFAHAWFGWLVTVVYLIFDFIVMHLMYKYYYDESLTEA